MAKRTGSGLKLVEATVSSITLSRQFCYESQRTELSTNRVSVVTLLREKEKGKESLFYVGSARFYGYLKLLKATRKGKKSKEGFVVTPGNRTPKLPHRRPRTNQLC